MKTTFLNLKSDIRHSHREVFADGSADCPGSCSWESWAASASAPTTANPAAWATADPCRRRPRGRRRRAAGDRQRPRRPRKIGPKAGGSSATDAANKAAAAAAMGIGRRGVADPGNSGTNRLVAVGDCWNKYQYLQINKGTISLLKLSFSLC